MGKGKYIRETKQFADSTSGAGVLTIVLDGHHGHEGTVASRPGYQDHFKRVLPAILRRLANEIEGTSTVLLFTIGVSVDSCGICADCRARELGEKRDERPASELN